MKDVLESPATGADRAIGRATPRCSSRDPQTCSDQSQCDAHTNRVTATQREGQLPPDTPDSIAFTNQCSGQGLSDTHFSAAAATESKVHGQSDIHSTSDLAPDHSGQLSIDAQPANAAVTPCREGPQIGGHDDDTYAQSASAPDLRFSDPLVQDIVEIWRLRNQMVKATTKLQLQAQAMCRRYVGGDKDEASKLYARIKANKCPDGFELLQAAIMPFIVAMQPVEKQRKAFERQASKMAERLPIAAQAKAINGLGYSGLARIVGECGDLSAYRTVSGVWKRAGLGVIDGKRQRRVSGDEAIEHGYSPQRRASFWNCMDALFKHQGKGGDATDWRKMYDAAKEKALASPTITIKADGTPNGKHADARARRYVMKAILKHLTIEWRKANA